MIYIIVVSRIDDDIAKSTYCIEDLFNQMFSDESITFIYNKEELLKIPDKELVVISGSKFSVNDQNDWIHEIEDYVKSQKYKKMLGICFGAQLIAKSFGANVIQNPNGWNLGVQQILIEDKEYLSVIFNHKEIIVAPTQIMKVIASLENIPVIAFTIFDNILGVQFHPEFNKSLQMAILMKNKIDVSDIKLIALSYSQYDKKLPQYFIKNWLLNNE